MSPCHCYCCDLVVQCEYKRSDTSSKRGTKTAIRLEFMGSWISLVRSSGCWKKEPYPLVENQHVIKVVKIPPLTRDSTQFKLRKDWRRGSECLGGDSYDVLGSSVPQVSEVGRVGSECQLNVGDRILEVNGKPVTDHPLPDIEKVLNHRTAAVQVTVEQKPTNVVEMPSRKLEESKSFGSLSSLELRSCSWDFWGSYDNKSLTEDQRLMSSKRREQDHRSRQPRRGKGCEERAASLSRLSDCSPTPPGTKSGLARTLSFREQARSQCTFRACDLVKGELLGKGFFGQVYKVTHCETKEIMVLKELYRLDEEAQRNFLKEVAVLRRLEHPNVLRFIGVLYKERKLHLITEYVKGGSLRELIQNVQHSLSWTIRCRIVHDISCGMAYLHSMGVIHRDLSSHNCLVREDMSVVVADFGLARITSEMSLQDRSRASKRGRRIERKKRYTVVGNPFWMAPEMMKGNKYDEKVDVFSFGIITCEVIGRVNADPDFLPRSGDFSLNQQTFLEKFCAECPEPLYRIAFMCCDLNPDKRASFEILSSWTESVASSLTRNLPFPKDLLAEIRDYVGTHSSRSPTSSESTTPDTSFTYMTTSSGASSNSSSGSLPSSATDTNSSSSSSSACVENTLSSACSSLSTFTNKSGGRLHSICEVDHSSNNNSMNSSTLSSPELEQQPKSNSSPITTITCNHTNPLHTNSSSNGRRMSASPS
ncbi:LIM domain kinase 1 isoform X2 [Folsomia candida]|uniref:LIM domain kinase 1 isoform X2 n=1 Tax=Folsomia candida TaxID=158441 RepID=UPI001604F5B3|nr:LIM domain kinase 1 isoform X2 [Folsomia candida]